MLEVSRESRTARAPASAVHNLIEESARRWGDLKLLLIFLAALTPVIIAPVFPLIDFYDHLARYYVLSHIQHARVLRENYQAAWALLPNIGCDVLGTALLSVVSPITAARILLGAVFTVQFSGLIALNRQLGGRNPIFTAILAVPVLYSFVLVWGFLNFLLGLGLIFWGAAWWMAHRTNLKLALPVACCTAIVIFFTHALAFALYGLLLGGLEVGLFLQSRPRRLMTLIHRMLPLAAQAVLPVLLFLMSPTSGVQGGATNAFAAARRLAAAGELSPRLASLFWYRLVTIFRVELGPAAWFDLTTFVLQAVLIAHLVWAGRLKITPVALAALALAVALVAFMPPALFGVGYVSDRMPLYALMIFVCALVAPAAFDRIGKWEMAGLALISLARLAVITVSWVGYGPAYGRFEQVAAAIPPGSLVTDLRPGGQFPDSETPRCDMYRPLLIAVYHQVGALFAFETQQPLRLAGPLRRAVAAVPPSHPADRSQAGYYAGVMERSGSEGFSYLLICNASLVTFPPPEGATVVVQNPDFVLLRLRQP